MNAVRLACCVGWVAAAACASGQTPEQRYHAALLHKFDGDAAGYYDEMLALAQAHGDSRAGRRARGILHGSHWVADAAIAGALASGWRNAQPLRDAAPTAQQDEARALLTQVAQAQRRHLERHQSFCRTFEACGLRVPPRAHYFYFLRPDEVRGGSDSENTVEVEGQVRAFLTAKKIVPFVGDKQFYAVAVGISDDDGRLDAWAINERGTLIHLTDEEP